MKHFTMQQSVAENKGGAPTSQPPLPVAAKAASKRTELGYRFRQAQDRLLLFKGMNS
jgi:hypothetical protein